MRTEWVKLVGDQLKQSAKQHSITESLIVDVRDRITRVEQDLLHLREQTRSQEQTLARIAEAASPTQLRDLVAQVAKHEQTLTRIMVVAVAAQLLLAPVVAASVTMLMQRAPVAKKVEKAKP